MKTKLISMILAVGALSRAGCERGGARGGRQVNNFSETTIEAQGYGYPALYGYPYPDRFSGVYGPAHPWGVYGSRPGGFRGWWGHLWGRDDRFRGGRDHVVGHPGGRR
jgi:hypothetical protein